MQAVVPRRTSQQVTDLTTVCSRPSGPQAAAFILPSCGRVPAPSCLTAKRANSYDRVRNAVIPIMARYAALTWVRRDRQQVADSASDARSECQTFAPRLQADRLLHHRSANAQTGGT